MKNTFYLKLSSIFIAVLFITFVFYYYLAIGFGNAVVETARGIKAAQKEWEKDAIAPIDSISRQIKELPMSDSIVLQFSEDGSGYQFDLQIKNAKYQTLEKCKLLMVSAYSWCYNDQNTQLHLFIEPSYGNNSYLKK